MTDTIDPDRRGETLDRRSGTLESLEDHVDEHIEHIEARLSTWLVRGLVAFGIIAFCCMVSLIGFGVVLSQIQDTRKGFVRDSCIAQNKRHDEAIGKFNRAADDSVKRNPEFAKEIEQGRDANVSIIDALAPKQDCIKLSRVAVGEEQPPPPVIPSTTSKERPG